MRRFDKNKNIDKANLLAEQRYLELKEDVEEGKVYLDPWDNSEYSSDIVNERIRVYQNARMTAEVRKSYVHFFKRIGLKPIEYKKINNSILKLKREGAGYYYAEGVIDGHNVRINVEPNGPKQWCWNWVIDGKSVVGDCGGSFREISENLDKMAQVAIDG